MVKRDIISVLDMKDDMPELVDLAIKLKAERGNHGDPLKGKTLAMIFVIKILVLRESHNGRGKLRRNYQITNPRLHLCNFGLEFYAIYLFGTAGLSFSCLQKAQLTYFAALDHGL